MFDGDDGGDERRDDVGDDVGVDDHRADRHRRDGRLDGGDGRDGRFDGGDRLDGGDRGDGGVMGGEAEVIHPRWVEWVAENLSRGADEEELVAALVEEGVAEGRARAGVEELARSPGIAEARRLWWRVQALEQVIRLRREHRAAQPAGSTEVARRRLPGVREFIAEHWVPGVPVVFTDLVTRWPAFGRWSPRDLLERFAEVVLEACVGRTRHAAPDPEWTELRRELTVRELVARVTAEGVGNDVYVIAKNAALERSGLRGLLEEIALPAEYFGEPEPRRMGWWFGPAGTHTPLHHDGDDSMFCQVLGRKRIRLAPPESMPLLEASRGVYCGWDPRDEAEARGGPERLIELVLAAGEALFIPAGWWHQVDALEVSMSVSALKFAWASDSSWYRPGTALRGRGAG